MSNNFSFLGLLAHNVDPVIDSVLILLSTHDWLVWLHGLFDHLVGDLPLEVAASKVRHSKLIFAEGHADEDAIWFEDSMNLGEHLRSVWSSTIAAAYWVKGTFIDDAIKSTILELKLSHIHLLVGHVWDCLLILLNHLLDHGKGDINISDLLVSIFIHFFRKT